MSAQPEKYTFPPNERAEEAAYIGYRDDEISLIDLWLVLVRRRAVILAGTLVCLVAGLAYILIVPPKYTYTTTIEIGTQIVNERVSPIEAQDSVRAKIAESYIPLIVQQYQKESGEEDVRYKIDVNAPKNSQVLVLTSKGTEDQEQTYTTLHRLVVQKLEQDHQRVSNVVRTGLTSQIAERERKAVELQEEAKVLEARIKRIEDERGLLALEIQQTEALLTDAERNRARAVDEVTDATRAMTLLMLSDQLRQNRERLTELKQRLMVELPNTRDDLEKALSDNRRAQENELDDIESLRPELSGIVETRAVAPSLRLSEPVGLAKSVVLVLYLLLGLVLSVFIAFFLEFLSKVKAQSGKL